MTTEAGSKQVTCLNSFYKLPAWIGKVSALLAAEAFATIENFLFCMFIVQTQLMIEARMSLQEQVRKFCPYPILNQVFCCFL